MKRKIQLEQEEKTISIPIRATYTYDRKTGELIDRQYEMADIPAKALAEFFFTKLGIDAKPREIEITPDTVFAVGEYKKDRYGNDCVEYLEPRFAHESLAYAFMKSMEPTSKITGSRFSIFKMEPFGLYAEDIFND